MDHIFGESAYILKRQGLAITGKYRLFAAQGKEPLLFIEEKSKWIPPSITYHVYADEKKTREVLTLKDRPDDPSEDMDIFDAQSGEKIGSLVSSADSLSEVFKDVYTLENAEGKPIGKVYEKSLAKSAMRGLVTHDLPQQMDIRIGEIEVGELRQLVKPFSYELSIDLSKDVSELLDHRLAVAAAIYIAYHQGKETD